MSSIERCQRTEYPYGRGTLCSADRRTNNGSVRWYHYRWLLDRSLIRASDGRRAGDDCSDFETHEESQSSMTATGSGSND